MMESTSRGVVDRTTMVQTMEVTERRAELFPMCLTQGKVIFRMLVILFFVTYKISLCCVSVI